MISKFLTYLKLFVVNFFIVACLWVMISINARLTLPQIFPQIYSSQRSDNLISEINWYIGRSDWFINHIGWVVGLKNYWRMFSPVDRFNWYMVVTAIHQDGEETLLPLSQQTRRNFWERNLVDFREAKFQLNIYGSQTAQGFYAQYLCRRYQDIDNPVTAIRIDLHSQSILSPDEAKRRGAYLEEEIIKRPWGTFECQTS